MNKNISNINNISNIFDIILSFILGIVMILIIHNLLEIQDTVIIDKN